MTDTFLGVLYEVNNLITMIENTKHVKPEFEAVIRDKDIDLYNRWALWCKAPSVLKNSDIFIVHFEFEKTLKNFNWFEDFYIERRQTVYLKDIVDNIKQDLVSAAGSINYSSDYGSVEKGWTQELLEGFMEDILSKNLDTFIYDW